MKSKIQKKAERLYTTDKVKLFSSDSKDLIKRNIIVFIVEGDTEQHEVHYNRLYKRWSCTCRFFTIQEKTCPHIAACMLMIEHEREGLKL